MRLSHRSLKNTPAVAVIVAIVMVFGSVSIASLPVQLTPDIERPMIAIETMSRAPAPEEAESETLEPIEAELEGLPGLKEINSFAVRAALLSRWNVPRKRICCARPWVLSTA